MAIDAGSYSKTIFVVFIILAALGTLAFYGVYNYSITASKGEVLDFCDEVEECVSHLKSEGMPTNYLEERGLMIECKNNVCVVKEK